MYKDTEKEAYQQQARSASWKIEWRRLTFLGELLCALDRAIDRRLVMTFLGLSMALILHRHRNEGGWMSQLGSYLVPANAAAGKKRIQRLLYSPKWSSQLLEDYLWRLGEARVAQGEQTGETLLAIWDESVVEKPESLQLEGLGPVRSSKAVRLKRIKKGYFNPPGGRPIFVPGFHWLQVLVCGMQGAVILAHARWWTTRGDRVTTRRAVEGQVLQALADRLRAGCACLRSRLCGYPLADFPVRGRGAVRDPLAAPLPATGRTGHRKESLGDRTGETLLGTAHRLGCPPPLSPQNRYPGLCGL